MRCSNEHWPRLLSSCGQNGVSFPFLPRTFPASPNIYVSCDFACSLFVAVATSLSTIVCCALSGSPCTCVCMSRFGTFVCARTPVFICLCVFHSLMCPLCSPVLSILSHLPGTIFPSLCVVFVLLSWYGPRTLILFFSYFHTFDFSNQGDVTNKSGCLNLFIIDLFRSPPNGRIHTHTHTPCFLTISL